MVARFGSGWISVAMGCILCWLTYAARGAAQGGLLPMPADSSNVKPIMLDAPIGNPAEEMHAPPTSQTSPGDFGIVHPWELPSVTVVGERPAQLREEQRVGTYNQPLWTTDRRFAEERVYVNPEGSLEFETWFIPLANRHGGTDFVNQNELEFGLSHRFQLDLYLNRSWTGAGGPVSTSGAVELRYALADWNKIWGNPTLYFEYAKQDKNPDVIEFRLLLGGEIAPRWHWGTNINFEHDAGGDFSNQYEFTSGVSYTAVDSKLDVGAELKFNETNFHASRGTFHDNLFIGPSFQFRPLARMHIDVVPLVGITHETPGLQMYVVLGWEF